MNSDFQKGLQRESAALLMECGPSDRSLEVVKFGIFIAAPNLANNTLFQVEQSSDVTSLVSHASFSEFQKLTRFGIAKPPSF